MSTIGYISQQYEDTEALFRAVNHSVILLKTCHYQLPGVERITEKELSEARQILANVLSQMLEKITSDSSKQVKAKELAEDAEESDVVAYVGARYRSAPMQDDEEVPYLAPFFAKRPGNWRKRRGALHPHVEKLQEYRKILIEAQPLPDELINLLDKLSRNLNAEAASIYQHLRRR